MSPFIFSSVTWFSAYILENISLNDRQKCVTDNISILVRRFPTFRISYVMFTIVFLHLFYLKIDIVRNLFSTECQFPYVKNGLNNFLLFSRYTLQQHFSQGGKSGFSNFRIFWDFLGYFGIFWDISGFFGIFLGFLGIFWDSNRVFHGISTTCTLTISKSHENSRVCRSCLHKIIHNTSFLNFINKYVYPSIIRTPVLYETAKFKFYRKMTHAKIFRILRYSINYLYIF